MLSAIYPLPTVFSKVLYCRHVKNQGLFKKDLSKDLKQEGHDGPVLLHWLIFAHVKLVTPPRAEPNVTPGLYLGTLSRGPLDKATCKI